MAKKAASAFTSERDAPEKETAAHYLVARREWLERYGDYISGTWSAPFPSGPKAGTGTGPAIAFPDGSALRSGVQEGLPGDPGCGGQRGILAGSRQGSGEVTVRFRFSGTRANKGFRGSPH